MDKQEQKIRETLDELIADGIVKPLRRHKLALGDEIVKSKMAGIRGWQLVSVTGVTPPQDVIMDVMASTDDAIIILLHAESGTNRYLGLRSFDLKNWDIIEITPEFPNARITPFVAGDNIFVAAPGGASPGGFGHLYVSENNGTSFEPVIIGNPVYIAEFFGLVYGNGLFVAPMRVTGALGPIDPPTNGLYISTDARGWTLSLEVTPLLRFITSIYGDGTFVVFYTRSFGNSAILVGDGHSWEEYAISSAISLSQMASVQTRTAYGNGKFALLAEDGRLWSSEKGIVWEECNHNLPGSLNAFSITFNEGKFCMTGNGPIIDGRSENTTFSEDLLTWSIASTPLITPPGMPFGGQVVGSFKNTFVMRGNSGNIWADVPVAIFEELWFSEIRNFYLDANPKIIGYTLPENPDEILPLKEDVYLPVIDGIRVVGKIHRADMVISDKSVWSTPHTEPEVLAIDQNGIITINDTAAIDSTCKIRLAADYNKVSRECPFITMSTRITELFRTTGVAAVWNGIAYGNGRFIVLARQGTQAVFFVGPDSTDNQEWTRVQPGITIQNSANTARLEYDHFRKQFVLVNGIGNQLNNALWTSEDGFTWTRQPITGNLWLRRFIPMETYLYTGDADLRQGFYTTANDYASEWVSRAFPTNQFTHIGIMPLGNVLLHRASSNYTLDGISWRQQPTGFGGTAGAIDSFVQNDNITIAQTASTQPNVAIASVGRASRFGTIEQALQNINWRIVPNALPMFGTMPSTFADTSAALLNNMLLIRHGSPVMQANLALYPNGIESPYEVLSLEPYGVGTAAIAAGNNKFVFYAVPRDGNINSPPVILELRV